MPRQPNVLHKEKDRERRPSFGRKPSFSASSPSKEGKRRTSSSSSPSKGGSGNGFASGRPSIQLDIDNYVPPLPDFDFGLVAAPKPSREPEVVQSPPASADSFSKMLSRTAPTPVNGYSVAVTGQLAPPIVVGGGQQSELSQIHNHIQEMANKRISTLDYLRKAYGASSFYRGNMYTTKS